MWFLSLCNLSQVWHSFQKFRSMKDIRLVKDHCKIPHIWLLIHERCGESNSVNLIRKEEENVSTNQVSLWGQQLLSITSTLTLVVIFSCLGVMLWLPCSLGTGDALKMTTFQQTIRINLKAYTENI